MKGSKRGLRALWEGHPSWTDGQSRSCWGTVRLQRASGGSEKPNRKGAVGAQLERDSGWGGGGFGTRLEMLPTLALNWGLTGVTERRCLSELAEVCYHHHGHPALGFPTHRQAGAEGGLVTWAESVGLRQGARTASQLGNLLIWFWGRQPGGLVLMVFW